MLQAGLMQGLASAPVPVPCPEMPVFMAWHLRHHDDALHQWLRRELEALPWHD